MSEPEASGERINARPWHAPSPPRRILAIRLQAFGDTVLTLPYLHALRRQLPGAALDFLTRKEVSAVPKSVVLFDCVFEIRGGRDPIRQLLSALVLLPRLLARRYDIVIDLQRNRLSRLVRYALGVRSWSEFDRFSPALAGERTRRTIEAIGLGSMRVYPDLVMRHPNVGLRKLRAAGWDGERDLVVLNPAGAFPDRNWPLQCYVEFSRMWNEHRNRSCQFLLLGLPRIADKAAALRRLVGEDVIDLVGQDTADEAFSILRRATLVVSEDSGLMHLSWVAGTPTIGLFGASRSVWAAPHGNYSALVNVCRQPDGVCMGGRCAEGRPHCLALLEPASVVDVGRRLVERVGGEVRVIYDSRRGS